MEKHTPILLNQEVLKRLDKYQKKAKLRTRNDAVENLLNNITPR